MDSNSWCRCRLTASTPAFILFIAVVVSTLFLTVAQCLLNVCENSVIERRSVCCNDRDTGEIVHVTSQRDTRDIKILERDARTLWEHEQCSAVYGSFVRGSTILSV